MMDRGQQSVAPKFDIGHATAFYFDVWQGFRENLEVANRANRTGEQGFLIQALIVNQIQGELAN